MAVKVPDELVIYGDALKLSQVFVNLFSTAMDAMGAEKGKITIAARRQNGHVNIRVEDSGPSMKERGAEGILDDTFEPAEEADRSGPGLFIARSIIEEHRGTIRLEENAARGAHFDIHLPAVANE